MILLVLWISGISLLGWNMSGTLGHICNEENWGPDAGLMVCRIYKTLFSFTLFASMSALAMVVLDLEVRKKQTSLGKYNRMQGSGPDMKPPQEAFGTGAPGVHRHDDHTEPWPRTEHELDDYSTPAHSRESVQPEHFGYTSPLEQRHYDSGDYGYTGSQRPL